MIRLQSALLPCAALCTLSLACTAQSGIQINKDNRTIAISAKASATAKADVAIVTIGFRSLGKQQDATYADAARLSNAIIDALTAAGVRKDAIASQNQSLTELQTFNETDKQRYAEGFRFTFTQSWRVTVNAADAGHVLDLAIQHGANESGNIDWQLHDPDTLDAQAAKLALERARSIAERMAEGLHTPLGALVYASNDTPPEAPIPGPAARLGVGFGAGAGGGVFKGKNLLPLVITPPAITRDATVYAVFAIQ